MYDWSYQYYRRILTPNQQQIYDLVYRAWFARKKEVSYTSALFDSNSVSEVIQAIIKDHPEVFWVNYYRYTIRKSVIQTTLCFDFFFDLQTIEQLMIEANAWKKRIISKVPQAFSTKDKAWLIYDYLARQVTYGEQNEAYSHTIIGPLSKRNHISVCEGIAKSYKYLCDEANIPCVIVFGDVNFGPGHAGPHAWNVVETEIGKRHIDVTAELELAHIRGKATENNFLYLDTEMKQYSWEKNLAPVCR